VCEQLEKLTVQDFPVNIQDNSNLHISMMNKSQSFNSLKKNSSFVKK